MTAQVPSVFFSGGADCFVRRIFLVVCQSELSVDERETRRLVKLSDLIEAKSLLSLFVKLLSLRLSEGYLVLCQVARALRLSEISNLICKGRFMEVFVVGIGEEEDQAASCIDLVRRCTASSISFGDFKLILRLH